MTFKKGQSGNPKGRKPREVERDYLARLRACVTPDDWVKIIDRTVTDAKRGDTAARKFLADYLIGAPVQPTENKHDVTLRVIYDNKVILPEDVKP
jgi:hypothetical protein